jgi:hypothetical protein
MLSPNLKKLKHFKSFLSILKHFKHFCLKNLIGGAYQTEEYAAISARERPIVQVVLVVSACVSPSLSDSGSAALLFFPLVAWPLFFIDVALGAGWAGSGESRLCNGVTQKKK